MSTTSKQVVWFNEVDKNDVALVGGKGANLGEMVQNGFPVPNGFIVTAYAYFSFLRENNIQPSIESILSSVNYNDQNSLDSASKQIKKKIITGKMSSELAEEIFKAYKRLGSNIFHHPLVAVRSSATAEDLPDASFAGQQETFLNVSGEANVLLKIKEAWASLFDARAIFYRHEKHFDHFKVGIAIPVQKMVESEKSGVMFTIDPVTNDKKNVVIEAIFGLGELLVQGSVTPDHYEVSKDTMQITARTIASQHVYLQKKGNANKEIKIALKHRHVQKITNDQIIELANIGKALEKHYYFPQDIEWAIEKKKIYITQTRPITTIGKVALTQNATSFPESTHKVLLTGSPASPGIASGPVKILKSAREMNKVLPGDILVAPQTSPDLVPAMKKAAGIITDKGGRTSHAAIVSRELGIPAVVGTEKATKLLKTGVVISVNGNTGEIYQGGFTKSSTLGPNLSTEFRKTVTKVYVNLGQPELAKNVARRHVDGVGLLRAEFIMANIGVHPKKMIREGKEKEYITSLAEGIEEFCRSFSPRPVVYRASDFKTNEYKNLSGGKDFEPKESNPMLGYRGAFRYIHDPEVFNLELKAIKIVREKKKLKNLWLMIPFVRTPGELQDVEKLIIKNGLFRSPTFKLWMMVEIPSNVIMLDKFIDIGIDGVSIGSNDLTMLILGTDRDNSDVASAFNEQDPAVLWALEKVIKTAKERGITSSLCGQAATLYPELVERLVAWGITSVSVLPDAIDETRRIISLAEKKVIEKK